MKQWWYVQNGQKQGPVTELDIISALANSSIPQGTLVWTEGMAEWEQVGQRPEFTASQLYPAQPGYTQMPGQMQTSHLKPHRGTLILVLGILSLVLISCCALFGLICGIIAWILGKADMKEMDQGIMDSSGRGTTNAGLICGIIGTIIGALGTIGIALYFIGIMSFFSAM